jgi:hypothetical protein
VTFVNQNATISPASSLPDLIRQSIEPHRRMDHRVKCSARRHNRQVFGDMTDRSSLAWGDTDDPFATFSEWSNEADEKAYERL